MGYNLEAELLDLAHTWAGWRGRQGKALI